MIRERAKLLIRAVMSVNGATGEGGVMYVNS